MLVISTLISSTPDFNYKFDSVYKMSRYQEMFQHFIHLICALVSRSVISENENPTFKNFGKPLTYS